MEWRVIKLETNSAARNMAIDNAVMDSVRAGAAKPTIRFYMWKPSAVSIGCFQSMNDEVNIDRCNAVGVAYVRRLTGGGAVYHDMDGEITYSVIGSEDIFPKNIIESYKTICSWIIDGLSRLGIKAEFAPINDIIVSGKKISGNAQTRREGVLLQHGTVLYKVDVERMFSLLNVANEKISDKMIKNAKERVTSVSSYSDATISELYAALLAGFTEGKDFSYGTLSKEESEKADMLEREVYSTYEWNFNR